MSYLVLARKFRPQNFKNVIGQEHIRKVLKNSLKRNRIAHAYIFSGPRGVGKTSLARIFAKSLNCQKLDNGEPCLECPNCIEIAQGINLAVREIDGASHNSVENVRELIDNFRSLPPAGSKYKVYIIDEVHMLSTSAFNALLKSLEEPPPNTIFILATTEVHKIPETVISRCQKHDFRSIDQATIESSLDQIIKTEGRKAETGVTQLISLYSEGSLRDSQSLLERVMAFSEDDKEAITIEAARQILGVAGPAQLDKIWNAIKKEDAAAALTALSEVFASGVDTSRFLKEFVEYIRLAFQNAVTSKEISSAQILELEQLCAMSIRGSDLALRSSYSEALLEGLVVKLALRKQREKAAVSTPAASFNSSPLLTKGSDTKVTVAPKAQLAASENLESATVVKTELKWESFLKHKTVASQPMLSEHLKRLEVLKFVSGELKALGPEFTVEYLQKAQVLQKLKQELSNYDNFINNKDAGSELWSVNFSIATGVVTNSLYQRDLANSKAIVEQKQKSAIDHPSVKSLQKAFPGSNVVLKK